MEISILDSDYKTKDRGYAVFEMTAQQLIEFLQENVEPDWKVQVGEYFVCSTFTRNFEDKVIKFDTGLA